MKISRSLHLGVLGFVLVAGAVGSGWESTNSPTTMYPLCPTGATSLESGDDRRCYVMNFAAIEQLPASLRVTTHQAWSDDYWADYRGGIAYRWQTQERPWNVTRPVNLNEVRAMKAEDLARLAPSEKFDIYRALKNGTPLDYALTNRVMKDVDRTGPTWQGICHGWSFAATYHVEPAPISVEAGGVTLDFAASDVKALLDYYYANYQYERKDVHFMGERCGEARGFLGRKVKDAKCKNKLNAGSFHIVLANQLGRFNEGFVLDVDNGVAVWNQPVVGVEFSYRPGSAPGASSLMARQVHVDALVHYIKEADPQWESVVGTSAQNEKTILYSYTLDIGRNGNVVGGAWDSRSPVPDFVWRKPKLEIKDGPGWKLVGQFSLLRDLLPEDAERL